MSLLLTTRPPQCFLLLGLLAPEQGWPSSSWTVTIYIPAYYSKLKLTLVFIHILACKLQQFKSWSFSALRLLFSVIDLVILGRETGRCPRAGITALSQLKASAKCNSRLALLPRGCVKLLPVTVGIYASHAWVCLERLKTELRMTSEVTKPCLWTNKKFILSHSPDVAAENVSPFQTYMHITWY